MEEEIKLTKEQKMLITLERFLEKEINESCNKITLINDLNRRFMELFAKYGQFALGDIYDVVVSMKTNKLIGEVHAAPSYEYYNYGYTWQTGFKIIATCIYEKDRGCVFHYMLKFDDPVKL